MKHYITLTEKDPGRLQSEVIERCREGWQPIGRMFQNRDSFRQPMEKAVEPSSCNGWPDDLGLIGDVIGNFQSQYMVPDITHVLAADCGNKTRYFTRAVTSVIQSLVRKGFVEVVQKGYPSQSGVYRTVRKESK